MDKNIKKQIEALAVKAAEASIRKNKATTEESAARKELLTLLKDNGLEGHTFKTDINGDPSTVEVSSEYSQVTDVDVTKLSKLVTPAVFWKTISATKAAVVKFAGTATADEVCTTTTGNLSAKVKVTKTK